MAQPGTVPARSRPLRWLHNLFFSAIVFLLLLDGCPCTLGGHRRVKDFMDPVVDKLGLWQGNWQLFAPDPDHMNTWVEAKVTFSDGSQWSLRTPDWQDRTLTEKFIQGRHPKFWDAFRLDRRKPVWPYIADYAARVAPRPSPDVKPTKVELLRHWWEVPPPAKLEEELAKFGGRMPKQDEFPNHFSYYTKEIR